MVAAGSRVPLGEDFFFTTVAFAAVVLLVDGQHGSNDVLRRHGADARAVAELAFVDQLTGLANRRGALRWLETLQPGSLVVLVDVDHFKRVNDVHGHATGDEVLVAVAGRLRAAVREGDVAVRWGGEEFLVLLRDADEAEWPLVAERLRAAVAATGREPPVTASVGGAAVCDGEDWEAALARADAALYDAKAAGRDRVVLALQS